MTFRNDGGETAVSPQRRIIVVEITEDDDIVSIIDHVQRVLHQGRGASLLLQLPEAGGVLREGLDLVRLRRQADELRVEIGLLTADVQLRRQARAVGIPVFLTLDRARQSRRGWWRGRRRREIVGLPTLGTGRWRPASPSLDDQDRREIRRRSRPLPGPRQWLFRYGAIFLFFITLALLYAAFMTAVPGAVITLYPQIETLQASQTIVADPYLDLVDYAGKRTPGRLLSTTQVRQASVNSSGVIQVPDAPARGAVLFVNQLAQPVEIPAGTQVSTSDGRLLQFQTLESVTLPDTIGSTVEVEVIAVEPGPEGNVAANLINQVSGALAAQVEVRNLDPLSGGGFRDTPAVSAADQERLRAQVVQFLLASAFSDLNGRVTEREFLSRDSLRVSRVLNETYSHEVGEAAGRLTVEMQVEIVGTAVNTTEASGLAYEALAASVPPGYALVGDSIQFATGGVTGVDAEGRVTFAMLAEGRAAADLPVVELLSVLDGQEVETAVAYLNRRLPLRAPPQIEIWPLWFDRMPYLQARMQTEIVP